MGSVTAVEIGADTCALASTSVQGLELRVDAAETLDPAAFPGIDAFTLALQQTRKSLKLPRRCRAVVWGLPDGATRKDPAVAPLIEPLTRAGFNVARVVTPCNALGALARLRVSRGGGAMCWLAINRNGVAIVVIAPGKLLYSHSFAWDSNVGATGSQARLLQRYSLVAFLAPEVRRAIAAARQEGATVDGVVTCGNLADLRALTMPLIEELDIEVETLDSLEGLTMRTELADKLAEVAPAIRLACAGAFARETRAVDELKRIHARRSSRPLVIGALAALAVLLAAGAYWWYVSRSPQNGGVALKPSVTVARSVPPAAPPKSASPATAVAAPSSAKATKGTAAPGPTSAAPSVNVPATPSSNNPRGTATKPPLSAATSAPASSTQPTSKAPPAAPAASRGGKPAAANRQSATATPAPTSSSKSTPPAEPRVLNTTPSRADKPEATPIGREAGAPEPLKDPVPRITAILVSSDRRLATVGNNGQIIAVGDSIGRRTVVRIDDKSVLLREPSGLQIRVALGGRVLGIEREDR